MAKRDSSSEAREPETGFVANTKQVTAGSSCRCQQTYTFRSCARIDPECNRCGHWILAQVFHQLIALENKFEACTEPSKVLRYGHKPIHKSKVNALTSMCSS